MKQTIIIIILMFTSGLLRAESQPKVKQTKRVQPEVTRVYKYKSSRVKRALKFTVNKKAKLC